MDAIATTNDDDVFGLPEFMDDQELMLELSRTCREEDCEWCSMVEREVLRRGAI